MWHVSQFALSANRACSRAPAQSVVPLWQLSQFGAAKPSAGDWYGTCVVGRASAGGFAPLWHVEHWPITGCWVWSQLVGRHAVVVWQPRQFVAVVGMCVPDLAVAPPPPWQVAQFVRTVYVL